MMKRKNRKLLVEIAYAEFDLNNYDEAERIRAWKCFLTTIPIIEEQGKTYNLLGLIEIYSRE